jgi:hypothetical protein
MTCFLVEQVFQLYLDSVHRGVNWYQIGKFTCNMSASPKSENSTRRCFVTIQTGILARHKSARADFYLYCSSMRKSNEFALSWQPKDIWKWAPSTDYDSIAVIQKTLFHYFSLRVPKQWWNVCWSSQIMIESFACLNLRFVLKILTLCFMNSKAVMAWMQYGNSWCQSFLILHLQSTSGIAEHHPDALESNRYPLCQICGSFWPDANQYRRHILTHTGERSHRCHVCNKTFIRSDHLQNHMLTHTGEKPFACDICGKRFNRKGNMKTHQIVHAQFKT